MNVEVSLQLFTIAQTFIKDKEKAREFVKQIEQTVDMKFEAQKDILATKQDMSSMQSKIAETKSDLIKWMFVFWMGQILALLAIVNFMLK
jgi:energy-converting hydrogenase A subunit M